MVLLATHKCRFITEQCHSLTRGKCRNGKQTAIWTSVPLIMHYLLGQDKKIIIIKWFPWSDVSDCDVTFVPIYNLYPRRCVYFQLKTCLLFNFQCFVCLLYYGIIVTIVCTPFVAYRVKTFTTQTVLLSALILKDMSELRYIVNK